MSIPFPVQRLFAFCAVALTTITPSIARCQALQKSAPEQAQRERRPKIVLQRGHTSNVTAFAFTPDGRLLATGGDDWTVKVWNVSTASVIYSLRLDGSWHFQLAFSPDGKTLAVFVRFGKAQIRDAQTGTLLRTLNCGSEPGGIVFSPDNSTLACGSQNGTITLWNYRTGFRLHSMQTHMAGRNVGVLAFSKDGRIVATARGEHSGANPIAELWEAATGRLVETIRAQGEIDSLAFAPDGSTLALGVGSWLGETPALEMWDIPTRKVRRRLLGHRFNIICIAFSKDGERIVSGDSQGIFKQWSAVTNNEVRSFGTRNPWLLTGVSPDARIAAEPDRDGNVKLFDVGSGKLFSALESNRHSAFRMEYLKDGATLVVGMGTQGSAPDGEIHFWDVRTGAWKGALTGMWATNAGLAVSGDGERVVAADSFGLAFLWKRATLSYLGQAEVPNQRILAVALSSNGALLAIAGENPLAPKTEIERGVMASAPLLEIWDVRTRTRIRSLTGHAELVTSVAFGADGDTLYSLSYDSRFIVWNIHTGTIRREIQAKGTKDSFDIDRAESVIVFGGDRSDAKTFDLRTGKPIQTYDTGDQARQVAISPNGKIVAAGDTKGTVWLWETVSGKLLRRIEGAIFTGNIRFSPDGTTLATVGGDEAVALWEVSSGRLKARFAVLGGLGANSEWLTSTTEGYYQGSSNAERYVRWSVDGEMFPAQRFRSEFRKPERVQLSLSGAVQTSLYGQQQKQEPDLRRLIRLQKVDVKREPYPGSKPEDTGKKYVGKDAGLYKSLTTQGNLGGDKALLNRLHEQIKKYITAGANPNIQGGWGTSPLMFMAWFGDKEMVESLLKRGANINAVDSYGGTPLLEAASGGRKEIVRLLLDRRAEFKGKDGKSLLNLVGDRDALGRVLVASVNNMTGTFESEGAAWLLLDMGADPNIRDKENRTPLILHRTKQANNPLLKLLIERGADVNAADNDGNSALSNAVRDGYIEVVHFLLEHGAKVHSSGRKSDIPLEYAIDRDRVELTRLLLDHGADPNACFGDYNRSALTIAAMGKHFDIAKLLLDRGARADEEGSVKDGDRSALTYAAIQGDAEMARLLISRGANVNIRSKQGLGLIGLVKQYAEQANDRFGIIALLKKAGAKE